MNSHMCHMITQYRNQINELTNQLNMDNRVYPRSLVKDDLLHLSQI